MQETQETQVRSLGEEEPLEKGMNGLPTPVFLPGEFHGRRSLLGCSPGSRKESGTTNAFTKATNAFSSLCNAVGAGCLFYV